VPHPPRENDLEIWQHAAATGVRDDLEPGATAVCQDACQDAPTGVRATWNTAACHDAATGVRTTWCLELRQHATAVYMGVFMRLLTLGN
jgi:hypothetical protein